MHLTRPRNPLIQTATVARYELLKHLRRRRLIAIVAITFLIAALHLVVPPALGFDYPATAKEMVKSMLNWVDFLAITAGAFFAGDAVSSEFEQKTGYVLFPNPVGRIAILFGKFIASLLSVLMVVLLYYGLTTLFTVLLYGEVVERTAQSLLYASIFTLSVLGITFLASTLLRGSMGATLLSFFTLILILPTISAIFVLSGKEPWFILTYAADIIPLAIDPPKTHKIEAGGGNLHIVVFYPQFEKSVLVMLAYFLITIMMSAIAMRSRQMQ